MINLISYEMLCRTALLKIDAREDLENLSFEQVEKTLGSLERNNKFYHYCFEVVNDALIAIKDFKGKNFSLTREINKFIELTKLTEKRLELCLKHVKFEKAVIDSGRKSFYFTAPKQALRGMYFNAVSAKLVIEIPTGFPESAFVLAAPVSKGGRIIEWFPTELTSIELAVLLALVKDVGIDV